jgi:hypothetical protein
MVVFLRLLFGMISKVKTELWWNVSQIYCWRYSLKCFRERERERKKDKWSKILQDPSALGRITGNTMLRGGVSIICSDSANRVCSFWHQPGPLHATHVLSPPSTPGTKGYKGGPHLSPGIVVHFVSNSRNSRIFGAQQNKCHWYHLCIVFQCRHTGLSRPPLGSQVPRSIVPSPSPWQILFLCFNRNVASTIAVVVVVVGGAEGTLSQTFWIWWPS